MAAPFTRAQSEGTISIALVDAPANRVDDPRARVYVVDHVPPGATISRRVEVTNQTGTRQTIKTYAGAATVNNGAFRFGDEHAENELTTWTVVSPSEASYAPNEAQVVNVTITVPDDATEGERYGVVWAAVASAPTAGRIVAVNRVGVRIYLSVGAGGEPTSDFEVTDMRARRTTEGAPQVVATVLNTGGRALDLSGELQLSDGPGGLSAGPYQVRVGGTLGVGGSKPVVVTLDEALPAGPWTALLAMESGSTKRSREATLTFPASGPTTDAENASSKVIVVVGGAGLASMGFWLFYRRRKNRSGHSNLSPPSSNPP